MAAEDQMYRDEDELEIDQLAVREFDVDPESGKVAVVHRNYQEIERKELEDELEEAETAQEELLKRETAAIEARKEGDRRVANLKSELERFDEAAYRASTHPRPTRDGREDETGAEESDEAVELD
jgi:hypothetical protein